MLATNTTVTKVVGTDQTGPASSATADVVMNMKPDSKTTSYEASQTAQFTENQVQERMIFNTPEVTPTLADQQPNLELNKFLSRPTLIQTVTWGSGGLSTTEFNPWTDFLTNSYIENKVKNFALFRGNLHLKLVITANPFTYGAALLSYTPLPTVITDSLDEATGALQNSQKPHIWVWPQNNAGGEMILPFFYRSNYVNLQTTSATDSLGKCNLEQVIALDTANDVAIPTLTIQIYAWMEDVMLEAPTITTILQAGSEYEEGPVQRIATNVAKVAGALTSIPVISPFALATNIGANAVSGIASLFGWSKPTPVEQSKAYKTLTHHGMISSEIADPGEKFALDPKSELSVDPRIVNLTGQDELSIKYLSQKEAYVANVNWLAADAVNDKLFEIPVWPGIMRNTDNTTYRTIIQTPMAYVSNLFRYWRGDVIFRFRLVASQYHRGRIKITYEPHGEVGTGDYTNVALTKIVDITEENDIEFCVPYMQETPWCTFCPDCDDTLGVGYDYGKTGTISHVYGYTNGTIKVQVLTTLSSPQASPSCHIIMYARAGEHFELAFPREPNQFTTHLDLQAGEEEEEVDNSTNPQNSEIVPTKSLPQQYLINFGERIESVRQVLARSTLSQIYYPFGDLTSTATRQLHEIWFLNTPVPPGYNTGAYLMSEGIIATGFDRNYCYSRMHPINWISACFAAYRGSIQSRFTGTTVYGTSVSMPLRITRTNEQIPNATAAQVGVSSYTLNGTTDDQQAMTEKGYQFNQQIFSGETQTDLSSMNNIIVETTDQHRNMLRTTRQESWLRGSTWDDSADHSYKLLCENNLSSATGTTYAIERHCNIAPDFNCHFFVCTPTIYYSTSLGQGAV